MLDARSQFGVVVRTVGFIILLYGAWYFVHGCLLTRVPVDQRQVIADYTFGTATAYLIAGVLLMRFADFIVRFAYPETPAELDLGMNWQEDARLPERHEPERVPSQSRTQLHVSRRARQEVAAGAGYRKDETSLPLSERLH